MSVGFKAPIPLSERSGWHVVGYRPHGWEAGAGLVLLPLVHLDLSVVLQETLLPVHRAGEVALPSGGAQATSVGLIQIFGVVR